jgi:hypothetical protein
MVKTHLHDVGKARTKERKRSCNSSDLNDWADNLVANLNDNASPAATKKERIEKRLAKKTRREENKQQLQHVNKPFQSTVNVPVEVISKGDPIDIPSLYALPGSCSEVNLRNSLASKRMCKKSMLRLKRLSEKLDECVISVKEKRKSWQAPFLPSSIISNSKTHRRRQVQSMQNGNFYQPRSSDYGGIGLARPSLFITLDDPSWRPKLEEEFLEHVPGFFGKQRNKAMKKQLDGQMLWRQLQKQKKDPSWNKQYLQINGKNISTLSPDERVEALLRAGAI